MEEKIKRLKELGLDTETGIAYTGSPEKYIAALSRYAGSADGNIAEIKTHLGEDRLQRYMVAVHAVKSNSKMIGHTGLFGAFESLELAAKNGDMDFITANSGRILEQYADFAEKAKAVIGAPAEKRAPAISLAEAAQTAEELLAALDDFDDETSAKLALKLTGFPFAEKDMEKLGKARKYISEFSYDEAAELIRELSGKVC